MKINILLPYKEKFDENKASSVSLTVKNNLNYTEFLENINIYGQNVVTPFFKKNFIGIKCPFFSFKSKNTYLAEQMINNILKTNDKKQIIEVHNRPYLVDEINKRIKYFPISLFFHNDPKTMKGSKSISERTHLLNTCAAIFCVSKYIKRQFLDGITAHHDKIHVLYNGVNGALEKFPKKQKEVLYIGRLVEEKGVDIYVDVVKSIVSQFPEWTFGLLGSYRLGDNKNSNPYAEKVIKKFNDIGDQANFYGFKNEKFVKEKMKNASIIVIPSLWEEPFGLVAAEAMSNAMAIVASKVGGIPEIIQDNGILIHKINHSKLKYSLVELIKDKAKRKSLQIKAWKNFRLTSEKSSQNLDCFRKIILKNYF